MTHTQLQTLIIIIIIIVHLNNEQIKFIVRYWSSQTLWNIIFRDLPPGSKPPYGIQNTQRMQPQRLFLIWGRACK